MENNGEVPQYYVEDSHPAIIDRDMWEAVQLEMERRRKFAEDHNISKSNSANPNNPFAGKVICGFCGGIYGRKVWNSTDESLRRYVWQCSGKYAVKGENRHIDERILQQSFIYAFNVMIENKDYFMRKWQKLLKSDNVLQRYKAKQFIRIIENAEKVEGFNIGLFFKMVEKTTVLEGEMIVVSFLEGTTFDQIFI